MNPQVALFLVVLLCMTLLLGFQSFIEDPKERRRIAHPSLIIPNIIFRIGDARNDGTLVISLNAIDAICNGSTAWKNQRANLNGTARELFDRLAALYTFGGYCVSNNYVVIPDPQFPSIIPLNDCPVLFYENNKLSADLIGSRARCPTLLLVMCSIRGNALEADDLLAQAMEPSFSCTRYDLCTMVEPSAASKEEGRTSACTRR